jgi:hypothetical protein
MSEAERQVPVLKDPLVRLALAVLVPLKLWATWRSDDYGVDGAYYLEVARHVRDGEGLVTNVALFHHGYPSFPHPTPIYPVWPLVLGHLGRIMPIDVAATWGPALMWLVFLLGAFHLVRVVLPERLAELHVGAVSPSAASSSPGPTPAGAGATGVPVHAGHLFLLVMGMNEHVFRHTTRPYTEGLAFLALLAAFWRLRVFFRELPSARAAPLALRALEVGAWLGFLVLNRSQFVIIGMGVIVCLAWTALTARRAVLVALLAPVAAGTAAALAPWYLWLRTWAGDIGPSHLLDFQEFAARTDLSPVSVLVKNDGPLDLLLDRLHGVGIGFDPYSDWSYAQNFGMVQWALPIWLIYAAHDALAARAAGVSPGASLRKALRTAWAWLSEPGRAFQVFLLVYATGWFVSLHLLHKANFADWNFGLRHALPAFPLFLAALVGLLRRGGAARTVAWALVAMSVFRLGEGLVDAVHGTHMSTRNRNLTQSALPWLDAQKALDPDLRIAVADPWPQLLGRFSSGVGIHWVHAGTTEKDFEVFFGPLACDYLLVPTSLRRVWSDRQASFDAQFEPVPGAPEGWIVYRPRQGDALPVDPAGTTPSEGDDGAADSIR